MKKITSIICILAASMLIFSACTPSPDSSGDNPQISGNSYTLYENGSYNYIAVLPNNPSSNESMAASELNNFLSQSTGKEITIVSESQSKATDKCIYIGETNISTQNGVKAADDAGNSGFVLKTVDDDLYILGGSSYGTLYGVYEFLYKTVGFEQYTSDEINIDKKSKIEFSELNENHKPSIALRSASSGPFYTSRLAAARMRLTPDSAVFNTKYGTWHNSFGVLTGDYLPLHPLWYNDPYNPTQLCYSAHGNAGELELMKTTVLEKFKESVNESASNGYIPEYITLTHQDDSTWCTCDTCSASRDKYGCDSAILIQFVNDLAIRLNKWVSETYPGNEVNVTIFAYYKTEAAPVIQNADGSYSPIDETVDCNKNVAILYAPIYADYSVDFYDSCNNTFYSRLKQWSALSDKLLLWTYCSDYGDYFAFSDTFNSMVANYKLLEESGVKWLFDEGRYNGKVLSNFDDFKAYLNAKLMWDTDADFDKLQTDFFSHYYGQAGSVMESIFNDVRLWHRYIRDVLGYRGQTVVKRNWTQAKVENFIEAFKPAYEAIEPLKTLSPERYTVLYDRILKEELAFHHILLELYSSNLTSQELKQEQEFWKTEVLRLGFNRKSEGQPVEVYWENW